MRIVVIGGGIIGCLTACHLKQKGVDVVVLERGQTGQEASWAGAGILCPIQPWLYPDSFTRLIDSSLALYPNFQAQIEADTGISIQWQQSGLLIPFFDDDTTDHWQAAIDWSVRFDWQVDTLDAQQARQREPVLSAQMTKALLWPDVAQLRNPRLLQAVRIWMQQLGVKLYENCEVRTLQSHAGKVSGVVCSNEQYFAAEQVLLACGSWSGELAQQMGFSLPVKPVKGQIVLLKGNPGRLSSMIKHDDAYFVPRRDGRVLVGASMEDVGFTRGTTVQVMNQLLAAMLKITPGLHDAEIEQQWMGFRPGSPDGLPFLGAVDNIEGLWVASGHYRNGVALAPITAQLMSDWMLGTSPSLAMHDFNPNRTIKPSISIGYP